MHTARSSSLRGGVGGVWTWPPWISPLDVGLDLIPLNFPPWVWAWIWSPSISPLAVGLNLIPLNFPPGCGSPWRGGLLGREGVSQHALRQTAPVNRMTDTCKNITLPQTSFAGGNNAERIGVILLETERLNRIIHHGRPYHCNFDHVQSPWCFSILTQQGSNLYNISLSLIRIVIVFLKTFQCPQYWNFCVVWEAFRTDRAYLVITCVNAVMNMNWIPEVLF